MKTFFTLVVAFLFSAGALAQSKTFRTVKNKFDYHDDVHSFSASGFLARTILWVAGEHEFHKAVEEIQSIRLITIPDHAFAESNVTVGGLKKLVLKDNFEPLANVQDHGDEVSLYLQSGKNEKHNRYLLVVDSAEDVVLIEIRGSIDPDLMIKTSNNLSYNE